MAHWYIISYSYNIMFMMMIFFKYPNFYVLIWSILELAKVWVSSYIMIVWQFAWMCCIPLPSIVLVVRVNLLDMLVFDNYILCIHKSLGGLHHVLSKFGWCASYHFYPLKPTCVALVCVVACRVVGVDLGWIWRFVEMVRYFTHFILPSTLSWRLFLDRLFVSYTLHLIRLT